MEICAKLVTEAKKIKQTQRLPPISLQTINEINILAQKLNQELDASNACETQDALNNLAMDTIRRCLLIYHSTRLEVIRWSIQQNTLLDNLSPMEQVYVERFRNLWQTSLEEHYLNPYISLLPVKDLFVQCRGLVNDCIILLSGQDLLVFRGALYHLLLSDADVNIKNGVLERI
jgi:hypothetical protein